MQPSVLRALEFDRIREALAGEALTPFGRERALALEPSITPDQVQIRLDTTAEAVAFVQAAGSLAVDAPSDVAEILATLEVEVDQPLTPTALLGLARVVTSVDRVASGVRRAPFGALRQIVSRAASFEDEVSAVHKAIDPSGDVLDSASPALRDIREKLRRQRAKLRSSLEALTRGRETAKYLQDQIITDRNGRYVLVVRAEHASAIPGIVHGTSASGASVYLEPLPTVELNNEVVALASREADEIRRILITLTGAFRARGDELSALFDVAADLDELQAKAALALKMGAQAPELAADGRVEFRGARHPLLVLNGQVPVASDLVIIPPVGALVISGPNTGGKTVALKAVGLLALMAQAGLLIPVEGGSAFTPFRSIFADIGDEQSIAASLSTFSAHIANLVAMDRALQLPALVLLDEVGGGTDPLEGGALGTAVIDHFRQRGAIVLATTHDDALKSYAATTDGVITAGFGFDPDTYAPTYRLLYGSPGRSLALEIAERLGMPLTVIAAARTRRSTRETQLADHLARVDRELAAIAREREAVEREQAAARAEAARVAEKDAQVRERELALKRRVDDKLNDRLREARGEIDRVVADLKARAESMADQAARRAQPGRVPLSTGEIGGLRAQARAALGTVRHQLDLPEPSADAGERLDGPPTVGQQVYVASMDADGIVRAVGRDVEVEIRGKRLRVPLSDLRRRQAPAAPARAPRAHGAINVTAPRPGGPARELVVIGQTVDEALARAEKFMDDALLADERRLRVVHGHGTGRLREALRAYFREHPLVASVAAAPDNEGGGGATIVELKE